MFNAKVYIVNIPSSGVALEEEHVAREVIARWNIEEGEKHGVAYLTIPNNYRGITSDIYIFVIDNYVDERKVKAAIQTCAKVMLFFNSHHDQKNTIESEVKAVEAFKNAMESKCVCCEFSGKADFESILTKVLKEIVNKQ